MLFRPLLRPRAFGMGLGLSIATIHLTKHQTPLRLDSTGSPNFSNNSYRKHAEVPGIQRPQLNPRVVRQISSGSIVGLCTGLAVSTFSRSLALLIGLLVVGIQWAASYGYNLPYEKLQSYVTNMNLRAAVQDNVAFKISFGTTFAMAAFVQF